MKKSLKAMIASATLLLATSVLAGCGNKEPMIPVASVHEHTFSEAWEASDSSHWHKATCEHKDVMSNVENHTFGAWSVRTQPTQTAEGVQYRTCTVCNYEQTAAIAKLDHQHVFSQQWKSDDDKHWHEATCHTNVFSNFEDHNYGNWSVVTPATETTKGLSKRTCKVCGHEQTQEIDKSAHIHTYASEWSTSADAHWKAATCEHANEGVRKDYGVHQFGDWEVDDDSTETVAGSRHRVCGVCGYVEEEALPLAPHTHTYSNSWSSNGSEHWHAATCACAADGVRKDVAQHDWNEWNTDENPTETEEGSKSRSCKVCGFVETQTIARLPHTHTFATGWSNNAVEHWHAASCEHQDQRADVAAHTWSAWAVDDDPTCSYAGTKHRQCLVCNYVENAPGEIDTEAHSFASAWTYDDNTHWHAATCGHAVKGSETAHSMNSYVSYPSFTVPLRCTVCGYIAAPAGRDTTQGIPSNYVHIEQNTRVWFTFTLQSASQLRFDFVGIDKATNTATVYVYDANGNSAGINGAYMKNTPFTASKTVPAGTYYMQIINTGTNCTEFDVLIHNYTYVYTKNVVDVMDITADGETNEYTMYQYIPEYGVSSDTTYYSIENEAGDELMVFNEKTLYRQPNFYQNGTMRFRNQGGDYVYMYTPRFIYRSAVINESPYTVKERTEEHVTLTVSMENYYKCLKGDTQFGTLQNSNRPERDAQLMAWYGSIVTEFTPSGWFYREGHYVNSNYPFFAADENEYSLTTNVATMTYDSSKRFYYAKNPKYGYNGYKITNETTASFSRFLWFSDNTMWTNNTKRYGIGGSSYILDENGYDITYQLYYKYGDNGDGNVETYSYRYWRYLDGTPIFEVKPGETYYIFENWGSNTEARFALDQTRYNLYIDPNYDDLDPLLFADSTKLAGACYEDLYDAKDFDSMLMHDCGNPDGQALIGYSTEPDSDVEYIGDVKDDFSLFEFDQKKDLTLYAQWIDVDNIVTTFGALKNYTLDTVNGYVRYYLNGLTDNTLTVKADDALTFIYAHGLEKEYMITEVGYDNVAATEISAAEMASHAGQTPYMDVRIPTVSGCHNRDGALVAIQMKTEFTVTATNGFDDTIGYIDVVGKGDYSSVPLYMDMFDNWPDALTDDKYFAGWSDDDTDTVAVLDGGEYVPIKDTNLTAVYLDRADSKVVALRYGISFVEIGGTEYLKLQVLDTNLTITTATHFNLVFSDGSTDEIGVTQILNVNGVNLPDGAKTSDGEVLLNVFNLQAKKDLILDAIQIVVA